jgi:hypothetical protein
MEEKVWRAGVGTQTGQFLRGRVDLTLEKTKTSTIGTIEVCPRTDQTAIQRLSWRHFRACVCVLLLLSIAIDCPAAELEQKTLSAFQAYVHAAQAQMEANGPDDASFLYIDRLPQAEKTRLYGEVENGTILVLPIDTTDKGKRIKIPDGMIHHWVGLMFARGVSLQQVQALLLDYSNYGEIYRPTIRRAQVVTHSDDTFQTVVQFYSRSPEMAFDTHFDVRVFHDDAGHVRIRSISTQVNQLQNPSNVSSPVMPDGQGNGYLWRLNDYWRLEAKDGGVFVQVESIELSRSVPYLLSWLIDPIVRDKSRDAVSALLSATRSAVFHQPKSQ